MAAAPTAPLATPPPRRLGPPAPRREQYGPSTRGQTTFERHLEKWRADEQARAAREVRQALRDAGSSAEVALDRRPPREATEGAKEPADCPCLTWEEHLDHTLRAPAQAAMPAPWWASWSGHPLASDLATLSSMLNQHEWKAAALIGGGILEVLLLSLLQYREPDVRAFATAMLARRKGRGPGKLDDGARWDRPVGKWGLYGFVSAASELGILSPEETDLCHRARRARNSIHVLAGEEVGRAEAQDVADAVRCVAGKVRA